MEQVFLFTSITISLLMFLSLYRAVSGPTVLDRLLALDAVYASLALESGWLRIALVGGGGGLLYGLLPYPVDYVPYTADHVVTQLQLLLFAGLAFFVLLLLVRRRKRFHGEVVLTFLILFFSEIITKTIGANYWTHLTSFTVFMLRILMLVLYPFVIISQGITRVFNIKPLFEHAEPTTICY